MKQTWLSLGFHVGFGSSDPKLNVKHQWELGSAMDGNPPEGRAERSCPSHVSMAPRNAAETSDLNSREVLSARFLF